MAQRVEERCFDRAFGEAVVAEGGVQAVHQRGNAVRVRADFLRLLILGGTPECALDGAGLALVGAWLWGCAWLAPLMGIVGALLVAIWAKGLIRDTSRVLLDREMDHPVVAEIREVVEGMDPPGSTHVTDLHVWRVGRGSYACALTAVSSRSDLTPQAVRQALAVHEEVVHATIELHQHHSSCPGSANAATSRA